MGFGDVLADLAEIGYDAEWQVIPAAAVGALHKRDRVFIVAYPNSSCTTNGRQREVVQGENSSRGNDRNRGQRNVGQISLGSAGQNTSDVANATSEYSNERKPRQREKKSATQGVSRVKVGRNCGNVANTQSSTSREPQSHGLCKVFGQAAEFRKQNSDGRTFSDWWETEPDVGRVANGVSNRVDRLRGLGNAVVPQVAELVGRLIGEHAKTI